jgi:hypothetical protein
LALLLAVEVPWYHFGLVTIGAVLGGAHGITPVVVRRDLDARLKARVRAVFLEMGDNPGASRFSDNS